MSTSTRSLTLEGRLPRHALADADAPLAAYAGLVSRVERVMLSEKNRKLPIGKSDYQARFGINARQFNSIKSQLDGKIASQRSNLRNSIQDDSSRLSRLKKTVNALEKRVKNGDLSPSLLRKVDGKRQRLARVKRRIAERTAQLKAGYTRICFGSARLFNAQHHLKENGYNSHDEWRADWRASRSSRIFIKGSKDEPCGCRNAQLQRTGQADNGNSLYRLTLNLPPALHARFGKTVTVEGLSFPRTGASRAIDAALARSEERAQHKAVFNQLKKVGQLPTVKEEEKEKPIGEGAYLADYGQALSFRLKRDSRGWRVLISFSHTVAQIVTSPQRGVVGYDTNHGFLSVVETDANGQLVTAYDIPLPRDNISTKPYRTALEEAAKLLVAHARQSGKPLVREALDFTLKKRDMAAGNPGYNRMLSSFAYARIAERVEYRAHKEGVRVEAVEPAYTSLIGRWKYAHRCGGSVHAGAAWVIARRGQGHVDLLSSLPLALDVTIRGARRRLERPEDLTGMKALGDKTTTFYREQSRRLRECARQWRATLPWSQRRQLALDVSF